MTNVCRSILSVLCLASGAVIAQERVGHAASHVTLPKGVYLWYKAGSIEGLKDGDLVTYWNDDSGSRINLDLHSGRPTYVRQGIAGCPVVRFQEGVFDGLQSSAKLTFLTGNPDITLFLVAKIDKPHLEYVYALGWGTPTVLGAGQMFFEFEQGRFDLGMGWNLDVSTSEKAFLPFYGHPTIIMCSKWSGPLTKNTKIFFNGQQMSVSGSDVTPCLGETSLCVGANSQFSYISPSMDVAEIIAYDRVLDMKEHLEVGYYLQRKYGISGAYKDPEKLPMHGVQIKAYPPDAAPSVRPTGKPHYLSGTQVKVSAKKRLVIDRAVGKALYDFDHWEGDVDDRRAATTQVLVDRDKTVKAIYRPGQPAVFYVAPAGNDAWSGTLDGPNQEQSDGPFATLRAARDAVRSLIQDSQPLRESVTVMVRGGKYFLEEPLRLGPKDSGVADNRVRYQAYANENPVLSGGRLIHDWRPYRGAILKSGIPEAKGGKWRFRQLFLDGERQTRSRYPNRDPQSGDWNGPWAMSEEDDTALEDEYIIWKEPDAFSRSWSKPTEGELFLLPRKFFWGDSAIIRIKSIDPEQGIIRLVHGMRDFDLNPHYFSKDRIRPEFCQFLIENLLEELDQPGEWCLDGEDGVVYFWPPAGVALKEAEVVVPFIKNLVHMHGAKNVDFSGFTLTETRGGEPMSHYLDVEGTGAQQGRMGWEYCGETIYLNKCQNCVVENNRIVTIGGNGIYLRHHNQHNRIVGNEIGGAGANGLVMEGSEFDLWSGLSIPPYPDSNQVTDNVVHHCGVYDTYAAGISLGLCKGNLIAHNHLHDLPHHAVNLGNSRLSRTILRYNRIERVCQVTSDNGAINCWNEVPRDVESPGHIIEYNLITNTGNKNSMASSGIYLDNYASNCRIYGNIIAHCVAKNNYATPLFLRGQNNVIENNIFVGDHETNFFVKFMGGEYSDMKATVFCRNIIYDTAKVDRPFFSAQVDQLPQVLVDCDYNVYFNPHTEDPLIVGDVPFSVWRQQYGSNMGHYDVHSMTKNPLLEHLPHGGYRLSPQSPAIQLGFQSIDVDLIGPRNRRASATSENLGRHP